MNNNYIQKLPSSSQKKGGLITAIPNPIPLAANSGLCSVTIQWITTGVTCVEVRVNKPDGALLSRSGGTGIAKTGSWVHDGITFYLQDVSDANPLTIENTLSAVTIYTAIDPFSIVPDLPQFASYLCQRLGCSHILAIGSLLVGQLSQLHPKFEIIVIDTAKNIESHKIKYGSVNWIEGDFTQPDFKITIPDQILKNSIVICTNIFENLFNPDPLVNALKIIMDHSPVCIASGVGHNQLIRLRNNIINTVPHNEIHRNHLNLGERLRSKGFHVFFEGSTAATVVDHEKTASVAIIGQSSKKSIDSYRSKAPSDFRVVAIISAYNEADIIIPSLQYLIDQGIEVYLIDNWSTDDTAKLAKQFIGRGLIGIEKFPKDCQPSTYEWESLLKRKEELAREIQADWFIHHDVDEIRESPWPDVCLKDAIYLVDQSGFSCIDHTVIEFKPVDDDFRPGSDFRSYFKYFEFGRQSGDFVRSNAWKNSGQIVSLAETGGHEVYFKGRRIYPYKFLLKHYRVRSQAQAENKIFKDRISRWHPGERAKGWHSHYDKIQKGHNFICSPADLEFFDKSKFYSKYLIERLSGVGIARANFIARQEHIEVLREFLENKNRELQAKIIKLEDRNDRLETQITDLKSYHLALSRKWWARIFISLNRLLGRKHRLDPTFSADGRISEITKTI